MVQRLTRTRPALLGGPPMFDQPRHIVRPRFPELSEIGDDFADCLARGAVTNHGRHVADLEKAIAAYTGTQAVVTSSGQAALMLMLRAAGISDGEVIVPAYTFSATPHAVRWCGAEPVFADIKDDGTMTLDPVDAAARITDRTRAILAVDCYGIACDYQALCELGHTHGLKVLFDSAPAFGTRVDGKAIGGFGDAQIFSFHATKPFSTMEGGCMTSRDEALLERAAALRNFGQIQGTECREPGINAKMTEICAIIGLRQLEKLDDFLEVRRRAARGLTERLATIPGLTCARVPGNVEPTWLYFPIILDPHEFGLNRDQLHDALAAENIFTRKYFDMPCHKLAAYADQGHARLEVAERVAAGVLSLPIYNDMSQDEIEGFAEAVRGICDHAGEIAEALAA